LGFTWSLLNLNCTCYTTKDAVRIGNSFITIPITRHYNHSQLSITLLRVYTIIILIRSRLQSLITLLHIYTGWLLSYQLLSQIVTHFPCLSPIETSLVGLLLTNWLVELLPENWLPRHFSSSYKPSIVRAARAVLRHRVYRRYLGHERAAVWRHCGCAKTYSNAVAWRHRGSAEKTPLPLTAAQSVFCRGLLSGRLPSNAPLRNLCRATQ
jgi:hypothetical protein